MTGFGAIAIGLGQAAAGINEGMVREDQRLRVLRSHNLEAFGRFRELFPDAAPGDMIKYREELAGGMNYLRGGLPSDQVIGDLSKRQGEKRQRERLANMAAEEGFKKQIGDLFQGRLKSLTLSDLDDDKYLEHADSLSQEFEDPRGQKLYAETIRPGLVKQRGDAKQAHAFDILKRLTDLNPDFTDSTVLDGYMPDAPKYVRSFVNQRAANNRLKVQQQQQQLQVQRRQMDIGEADLSFRRNQDRRAQDQMDLARRDSVFTEVSPQFRGIALKGDAGFPAFKEAVTAVALGKGVQIPEAEIIARYGALKSGAEGDLFAKISDPNYELARNADIRAGNDESRRADAHPLTIEAQRQQLGRNDTAEARAAEQHQLQVASMKYQLGAVAGSKVAEIAESVAKDFIPLAQAGGDVRADYFKTFSDRLAAVGLKLEQLPAGIIDSYFTSMASSAAGTAALAGRAAGLAAGDRVDKSYDDERNKVVNAIESTAKSTITAVLKKNHPMIEALADTVRAVAQEYAITEADANALVSGMSRELGSYDSADKLPAFKEAIRKQVQAVGVKTVAQERQDKINQAAERRQVTLLGDFSKPGSVGMKIFTHLGQAAQGVEIVARAFDGGEDPNSPTGKQRREWLSDAVKDLSTRIAAATQAADANLHGPQIQSMISRFAALREAASQLEQSVAAKSQPAPGTPAAATPDGGGARMAEARQIAKSLDPLRRFRGQPDMTKIPAPQLEAIRLSLLTDAYKEAKARWSRSKSYPIPTEEELAAAIAEAMPSLYRRDQPSTGVAGP